MVGEAVTHLDAGTRAAAHGVPWQRTAGLRDIIVHEYFRVELSRIGDVTERDRPLRAAIEGLLDR